MPPLSIFWVKYSTKDFLCAALFKCLKIKRASIIRTCDDTELSLHASNKRLQLRMVVDVGIITCNNNNLRFVYLISPLNSTLNPLRKGEYLQGNPDVFFPLETRVSRHRRVHIRRCPRSGLHPAMRLSRSVSRSLYDGSRLQTNKRRE